jgi:hypothetical protein
MTMRKTLSVAIAFLASWSCSWAADNLPDGAIKKGTLANAKLIRDANVGVVSKVAVMGCTKPGDVDAYVVAMPSGAVGQRRWKELWVVSGCGNKYPVNIEFYEDGPDAANWTIGK